MVFVLWDRHNEELEGMVGKPAAEAASKERIDCAYDDTDLIRCVDTLGWDGNGLVSGEVELVESSLHTTPEPEEPEDQDSCRYGADRIHCERIQTLRLRLMLEG